MRQKYEILKSNVWELRKKLYTQTTTGKFYNISVTGSISNVGCCETGKGKDKEKRVIYLTTYRTCRKSKMHAVFLCV